MPKLFHLIAIAFAAFLVNQAQAEDKDCTLKLIASLPMGDALPERVVVEVSIAGKPKHFMVDSGGVYSTIYSDVSDALGLQTHAIDQNIEIYDVAGDKSKRYAFVPSLKLGELKGDDIPLMVDRRAAGGKATIDGVLGPDVLSRFDLEFDIAGKKLNLISPDHCEGKVVYWSEAYAEVPFSFSDAHILLPMTLDGHDVKAILDTGAIETHLSEQIGKKVFGLSETSPGMERIPDAASDSLEQYRRRFASLGLAGLTIANPLIYILPDRAAESFRNSHMDRLELDPVHASHLQTPDLLLGMNVLSKLHFYVAYREHKLYFTAANAH